MKTYRYIWEEELRKEKERREEESRRIPLYIEEDPYNWEKKNDEPKDRLIIQM